MAPHDPFPANLKRLRLERGLTQHQLAMLIGQREGNIRRWENGHNEPDFSSARALAKALDVTLDELVDDQLREVFDDDAGDDKPPRRGRRR